MKEKYFNLSFIITIFVSVYAVIMITLRGQLFPIIIPDSIDFLGSIPFLFYGISLMFCYVIPFLSFYAILILLKTNKFPSLGYIGFFFCVFGTALALPSSGVVTFAVPEIAKIPLNAHSIIQQTIEAVFTGPLLMLGITSAVFYSAGPILIAIGLIKTSRKLFVAAILFGCHGLLLSFGFSLVPLLIVGWVFLGISSLIIMVIGRSFLR